MIRSYKYRLYPNREQRQILERMLEIHRRLYNDALTERRLAWKMCKKSISLYDQRKQLTEIRKFDEDAAFANCESIRQTLNRLQKAFDGFFRRVKSGKKPGYPRYKGKGWFKSICYVYGNGLKLKGDRLYIQRAGEIRMFQHRPLPAGTTKMAIIKRDDLGNWYTIFQIELPDTEPSTKPIQNVGIDMGLEVFATLSTGEMIENPRRFRASEEKLAILQRHRSRCKRGSCQYRKLTHQIRTLHERIANQRRDFQHKTSAELVKRFSLIAVENLNIHGLARSHVSKSISDAGWGYFISMLEYKAENAGIQIMRVNPNGTSQICSTCGCIVKKSLSVRIHTCPHCDLMANRDVNAALNILALGQRVAIKRTAPLRSAEAPSF